MSEGSATARADTPRGPSNLTLRIVAAAILAPLALAIAWAGGWWWIALTVLAGIGIFAEWVRMSGARPLWLIAGLCYAALPSLAAIALRADSRHGFAAIVFVLVIVWASDTFGYVFGRLIGGAKLWPRISPKKTWAGAIGGLIGSALGGAAFGIAGYSALALASLGALLAIAAQAGDLLESAIKRRFGVKDSGNLIPGHGGLMDRLDAFVAAVVLAALIGLARGSGGTPAEGLLLW